MYIQLLQLLKESLEKQIRLVRDSNPVQVCYVQVRTRMFLRLPFCNCKSCVYNCNDLP